MDADRSMVLSAAELAQVTGKKRHGAQAKELRALRIPFRVRRDGSLLVLRVHVEYETTKKLEYEPAPEVSL